MKEFNIFLEDRIKEYKIIVSAFKFKEILSYADQLVLSNCINLCTLYDVIYQNSAFISPELKAEIVAVREECYFLLNDRFGGQVDIQAEAEFKQEKIPRLETSKVLLDNKIQPLLGISLISPKSIIQLGVAPVNPHGVAEQSFLKESSTLYFETEDLRTFEEVFLKINSNANLVCDLKAGSTVGLDLKSSAIILPCNIERFTKEFIVNAFNSIQLLTNLGEVEISHSLGRWTNLIHMDESVEKALLGKFTNMENFIGVDTSVRETLKISIEKWENPLNFESNIFKMILVVGLAGKTISIVDVAVEDTRLDLSSGKMSSSIEMNTSAETSAKKFIKTHSAANLIASMDDQLVSDFAVNTKITFKQDMSAYTKRYALFDDYITNDLANMDSLSLEDLDYIILEG